MPEIKARLLPNLPSPQPVGTVIVLLPRAENLPPPPPPGGPPGPPKYAFRYAVSVDGGPFHVVRDFSQQPQYLWRPELFEHEARVRVTARDNESKFTVEAELPYRIVARAKGSEAVVTPTGNPLVALFSAPACPAGSEFRVAFRPAADEALNYTPPERCREGRTNNVYVAGMRADTGYEMRSEIIRDRETTPGKWMPFHTGIVPVVVAPVSVPTARPSGARPAEPVLVHSIIEPWHPMATDLDGNIIWYGRPDFFLTRVLSGGRFLGLANGPNTANDITRWQLVVDVDLAGNIIRETNASRVAEQLERFGIKSECKKGAAQCVPGFHHEAIRLPNGHTMVLAGLERMYPAGTQGSKEPVDVLGDLVIDLDEDLQVTGAWNAFDHMDVKRASMGAEKCKEGAGDDGCTAVFLAPFANGWLHSNSLDYIPASGDFIMSIPEQDWVVKVDWKNGQGNGKILWHLGRDGDFTTTSDDPYPWFSYQHDARFLPGSPNRVLLFDDGHRRKSKFPKANNRGQVWELDENAKTAKLVYNADLGVYALAVGSAQSLDGGGFAFDAGFLNPANLQGQSIETGADGRVVYVQQTDGGITYRTFRVKDLYSAPR
jgi:hypothetical protein